MKAWALPIVMAVLVVAASAYAATSAPKPTAPALAAIIQEYVPGLKRWPGTWEAQTIKIGQTEALGKADVTVDIEVARAEFKPAEIKVKKGQVVTVRLKAKDNGLADMPELAGALGLKEFSGHGFQILGPYDVWITGLRKGVTKEVTFKATTAGEFAVECVVFCSPDHYLMTGKLIVQE